MGTKDWGAVCLTALLALITWAWNAVVGLHFRGDLPMVFGVGAALAGLGIAYAKLRPQSQRIANLALYAGLWVIWSTTADILTYLVATWNLPLQDQLFSSWDHALGFDWPAAFGWVTDRPKILFAAQQVYHSYYPQAVFGLMALAIWGGPGANAKLLLAATIAFAIALLISGLLPSLGPAELNHLVTAWGQTVRDLRQGSQGPYYIIGIINFPSFHAVLAVLYTIIHWPHRIRFYGLAALNALLLLSTPFVGGHYLVDVLAGIALALFSWRAAGWLTARNIAAPSIRHQEPISPPVPIYGPLGDA